MIPKFEENELNVVSHVKGLARRGGGLIPVYGFPVTMNEGMKALLERRPVWQTMDVETVHFAPRVVPDNVARGLLMEGSELPVERYGGKDMFGVEWIYIPDERGSMVRPGKPLFTDANGWREKLAWPDVEQWDWLGCAADNADYLQQDRFIECWFLTGWFERLISFMDFENALVAMIDADQQEAVKDLMMRLSDLYIRIFDKMLAYFPQIDGFMIHDDWGSQKDTFFNPGLVREIIVPAMRKVTDFIHSKGRFCELHSCGQNFKQVPNMILAGWDAWVGQTLNDTQKIYELYGDKILIGVVPEDFDPEQDEESLRASARLFARKYCNPQKPCMVNTNLKTFPNAFREELYRESRIRFSE